MKLGWQEYVEGLGPSQYTHDWRKVKGKPWLGGPCFHGGHNQILYFSLGCLCPLPTSQHRI